MKINNYSKDIKYADNKEILEKTNKLIFEKLSKKIPISEIIQVKDKKQQFLGIDKIIKTKENKFLKLEEKIRRKDWGDFLIEIIANNRFATINTNTRTFSFSKKRGIGWGMKAKTNDYNTDILLYYFEESNTGYLFSWKKFSRIIDKNLFNWILLARENKFGFSLKKAYNYDNYKKEKFYSENITIPKKIFLEAYKLEGGEIL
jgi:hypothetical protein